MGGLRIRINEDSGEVLDENLRDVHLCLFPLSASPWTTPHPLRSQVLSLTGCDTLKIEYIFNDGYVIYVK